MWQQNRETKADDNPAGSPCNTELSEKEGRLILVLKWSDSAKRDPQLLEKSLKPWLKKEKHELKCSVIKLLEDNNALIKFEPYTAADVFQTLCGETLHLTGMQPVTVESILEPPKMNSQAAADASRTSTPSTSTSGHSNKDHIPEQVGHRAAKSSDFQKGNNPGSNPGASLSDLSDDTEKGGKLIILKLTWSKIAKKSKEYLQKALLEWLQNKNEEVKCSVVQFLEAKDAEIKVDASKEILQELSGEVLTLEDDTKVTVESVIVKLKTQTEDDAPTTSAASTSDQSSNSYTQTDADDQASAASSDTQQGTTDCSPNLNTQTADDASTPSTSDEGRVHSQSDQLPIQEQTTNGNKKKSGDGVVSVKQTDKGQMSDQKGEVSLPTQTSGDDGEKPEDKATESSNVCNSAQTGQSDAVQHKAEGSKADNNPGGSLSNAELSAKGQMNSGQYQDSSSEQIFRFDKLKSKDDSQSHKPTDSSSDAQNGNKGKMSNQAGEAKADENPASSASNAEVKTEKNEAQITLVLKWSKQPENPKKQQIFLQKSLQTWFNKEGNKETCSEVKILEGKNAQIKIEPHPGWDIDLKLPGETLSLGDGSTVTIESIDLDSPNLNPQTADDTSKVSQDKGHIRSQSDKASDLEGTSCDGKRKSKNAVGPDKHNISGQKRNQNDQDSTEDISPEKRQKQTQEDCVSLPVTLFWYLRGVYKDEIRRIEQQTGCTMDATVKVTFKDGSQDKALSKFTDLVQKCFNESRESVIPVQDVSPERCSEAFKLIQKYEKKALLTLTPKEMTVCGPDGDQIKRVLERKEKADLLHDDTPTRIKMTITDPLTDAGIQMEEGSWRELNVGHDDTIKSIKEKFDVDFREVRMDGDKVQVKASYNGPEGNPGMESHAVRALLRLYQKSVTSCLNYKKLQGESSSKMHEDESEKRSTAEGGATGGDGTEENCPICLSRFTDKKSLKCKHEFCKSCLEQAEQSSGPICPVCRKVFGVIQGNQPDGNMSWIKSSGQVPGFSHCGTITITYNIPSGRQTEKHPKPGHWYTGTSRTAFLPDTKEGNEVLMLLKKAFDQKLIFTIGASRTTGYEDQVTWNDIHHKTSLYGGPDSYGYPDPNYLSRVREELKAKGIE